MLELVHFDLCGPMSVPSKAGFLYYVIFVDDFSRKTWIYFLKCKESREILKRFKEFKALTENFSGKKIKTLRIDNGKEYTSEIFKEFCMSAGIKREFTVAYNPQQNRIAERKNRTIVEAAKAMLLDQNIETSFWTEASRTAVYIQNRCPHSHLDNKTPEEAFTGIKPDISHFRIFGCLVYIHVPKEKRFKLEPSEKKGVFVGYSETSKAYRIFIPGQKQIELSRDVIFEEDIAFKRARSSSETKTYSPRVPEMEPAPEIQREHPDEMPHELPSTSNENTNDNGKKRPLWARKMIKEAEDHATPKGTFRESKRPKRFSSYVALMNNIINSEPVSVTEACRHQAWKDAMTEEYQSILKNDVWDIVPRPKEKSVVSSKWLFKIKHAADGSIEKHKARFVIIRVVSNSL